MALDMKPPAGAETFLKEAGWAGATIAPLAGDASFRRYFRVTHGAGHAVLMDAPPPHEDPRPFIHVAEYLIGLGLSAPRIMARDLRQGLLLIEDFGSHRMREAVDAEPGLQTEVYRGVTQLLVELHRHAPPQLKHHGLEAWLNELDLFIDWYCPAVGIEADAESYRAAWRQVLSPIDQDGATPVTVLRDYHAENVMLIDGRSGIARFGLLDFQDALSGHPAYDLVSMLEDARRDVPPEIERQMIDLYLAEARPEGDFECAYWALGAQRNTRILGVFCRLWKRDAKPHYTRFQPRMWRLLERDLAHPALAPVRNWFDLHVPADKRAPVWAELAA